MKIIYHENIFVIIARHLYVKSILTYTPPQYNPLNIA